MLIRTTISGTFVALVLGGISAYAQDNQQIPPAVIAVVDSQRVLINAQASQGIRTQVESIRDIYSQEIARLEDELRTSEQELQRQQAILAPEAFSQRMREFEDRVDYVQRLVEERNRQIDRAFNQAMDQVRAELFDLVVEMSEHRGFNIILERGDLLFAVPGLDITDAVIATLDERLPNVFVPMPEN